MKTAIRPEAVVFSGAVEASGILLPTHDTQRIWALWTPGATLWDAGEAGWFLRWPTARPLDARACLGRPVVQLAEAFVACPLTEAELEQLSEADCAEKLAHPVGGALLIVEALCPIDPSDLITLNADFWTAANLAPPVPPLPEAVAKLDVEDPIAGLLGEPPKARAAVLAQMRGERAPVEEQPPSLLARALRRVLVGPAPKASVGRGSGEQTTGLPPATLARPGLLARLFGRLAAGPRHQPMPSAGNSAGGSAGGSTRPPGVWRRLFGRRQSLAAAAVAGGEGDGTGAPMPQPPTAQPRPSWRDRLLKALADRGLLPPGVLNAALRAQRKYVDEMIDLFERGDLREALRHGIPLGGEGSSRPSFGAPSPRDTLEISLRPQPGGVGVGLDTSTQAHVKRLYQAAVQRLKQAKKYEEAAYALVELLGELEAAVDLLDQNGLSGKAADLAQARGMPAERVAHLLYRAGKLERAMAYARQHDAFGVITWRLASKDPEAARVFRLQWAEHLEAAGQFLSAADLFDQNNDAPERALDCLKRATALGQVEALARLLAKPDLRADFADAFRDVLLAPGAAGALHRAQLADAVLDRVDEPAVSLPLFRHLAADFDATGEPRLWERLQKLRAGLRDEPLAAERFQLERSMATPHALETQAPAPGGLPIEDAVVLPDLTVLVALGEGGLAVVNAHGRATKRYSAPATHLVPALEGGAVLALVKRGDAWRVQRLDFPSGTIRDLGTVALDVWAQTFDGEYLVVGQNLREESQWGQPALRSGVVMVLDLSGDTIRRRWSVETGPITALWQSAQRIDVLGYERPEPQAHFDPNPALRRVWHFELPGPILRSNRQLSGIALSKGLDAIPGDVPALSLLTLPHGSAATQLIHGSPQIHCKEMLGEGGFLCATEHVVLAEVPTDEGLALRILRWGNSALLGSAHFPHASRLNARSQGQFFVVWDDRGRVLLGTLAPVAELRWLRIAD